MRRAPRAGTVLTFEQYAARWTPEYHLIVLKLSRALDSDVCSGVPDFYAFGCREHDIAYRLGKDPLGYRITREEADRRLRWYIQMESPLGPWSPMAWWRWAAVRLLGGVEREGWRLRRRPWPSSTS